MSGVDGHTNAGRSGDTPSTPLWQRGLDAWRRLRRRLVRLRYRLRDRAALIDRLREAQGDGLLDIDALTMLEGVLHVSDMQVRDIIVPRAQMDVIARDSGLDQIIDDVVESAHSRFPVIGDSRDDVVGILLAKDVLRFVGANAPEAFDIQEILRPAVFVPESKRLNVLLKEFRLNRNHMAIVVDEYGGVAGLVTIEDVLEQIVGEIEDEHDVEDYLTQIMRHPSGRFTIKALTPLEEFNAFFDVAYDLDEFDTVGGLVLNRFGHMPKRGDQVEFDDFVVRILRADARRIHLLELRHRPKTPMQAGERNPERDGERVGDEVAPTDDGVLQASAGDALIDDSARGPRNDDVMTDDDVDDSMNDSGDDRTRPASANSTALAREPLRIAGARERGVSKT